MKLNKSELIQALGDERCIANEQNLKTTVDFIFEDNARATEFLQKTDPAVVIGIFQSMKKTKEHNQDIIQNDQLGNNEIEDDEIVTETVLIEEQPEIQDNKSGL